MGLAKFCRPVLLAVFNSDSQSFNSDSQSFNSASQSFSFLISWPQGFGGQLKLGSKGMKRPASFKRPSGAKKRPAAKSRSHSTLVTLCDCVHNYQTIVADWQLTGNVRLKASIGVHQLLVLVLLSMGFF